jgi:hypothetical protein
MKPLFKKHTEEKMTSQDEIKEKERQDKGRMYLNIATAVLCVIVAIGLIMYYKNSVPKANPKLDTFANCIADKGVKFYGAWWCPHCVDEKKAFGTSFKILEDRGVYVECANKDQSTTQECLDAGISGFPTWKFPETNETIFGFATFPSIQERTGCAYQ